MAKYETPNEPSPDIFYNVDCLHEALNDSGYICSHDFTSKVMTSIHTKPIRGAFLYGMAGTGKSYLPMVLAKVLDRQLFVHQCTQGTREEDLLVKTMPSENTISGVKIGHGKIFQAAIESRKRPVMLMLDEWDKTRPSADGFFLDFLQYGRLSLPGVEDGEVNANLDNLTIFITANDEREFHEALLRRFPMISVSPIEPADVVTALELTHKSNKLIPQMIDLYTRSISASLPKPATIQELRQLMDAVELLGSSSDWDTLVYQYITKTPENHILLSNQAKVESIDIDKLVKLRADDYGVDEVPARNDINKPKMPSLRNLAKFNKSFSPNIHIPTDASVVFKRNDKSDDCIMQLNMDKDDPETASMPEWGSITKKYDFLTDDIVASSIHIIHRKRTYSSIEGEILIKDKYITRQELVRMLRGKWLVHKRDSNEIIARHQKSTDKYPVDLRWKEGEGMEIIAPLADSYVGLKQIFTLNAHENLAQIKAVTMLNNRNMREISDSQGTHLAVRDLKSCVQSGTNVIGNSVLKSMSEHNGYCQGIYICSPSGDEACSSSDIPHFHELLNGSGKKYKLKSIPNGFLVIANNLHVCIEDIDKYQFGKMSILIEGAVHPDILSRVLDWFGCIPLYKCFQHDGTLRDKLEKAGWKIYHNNVNALVKSGIYALFVYDYVLFCGFLNAYDATDEATLAINMKTKINRIRALEKAHKPNQG